MAFCAIVAFSRGRECYYLINNAKCPYKCCGEEGSMQCADSCDDFVCSSDEDCGYSGCCSNGKCNDPKSDCDSAQIQNNACSDGCPEGCCSTELGQCQTGCSIDNWNCSLNEACPSDCCHNGKCRSSDLCALGDDDRPIVSHHESSENSQDSTVHFRWKVPIIVIVVVIAVALKITFWVLWVKRRSRVVVIHQVLTPSATVQTNADACDIVPLISQDEQQIKH